MDILDKLFGGADKVKVMRLFLLNPTLIFDQAAVSKRSKITAPAARREIGLLRQINFIKSKNGEDPASGQKIKGWQLNPVFPFLNNLRGLIKNDLLSRQREVTDRFANCGKIKLLLIAGLFIHSDDSRADLLLVGDNLKRGAIEREIKTMESEVGRELAYAVFDTTDFLYRLNAYDKFVRDILDYPHEKIIDRLNLAERGYPHTSSTTS